MNIQQNAAIFTPVFGQNQAAKMDTNDSRLKQKLRINADGDGKSMKY